MKKYILIALCLVMTFGAVQAVANAYQVEPPGATAANQSVFLPLLISPVTSDLTITRLEISQAIQTPGQTVPLVANRPTLVRLYLQALGDRVVTGVYISFSATRDGTPIGAPLVVGPVSAPLATSQGDYASTVNVSLPGAWLSGNVTLTATADPSGAIKEINETNNQRSTALVFNVVPPLDLQIVPIHYYDTRSGMDYPAISIDPVSNFAMRTFPLSAINVTYHSPPIDFAGDLSQANEWSRLLDLVSDIKHTEYTAGTPLSKVYYGLVPPGYDPPQYFGIGWLGYRAAVGSGASATVGAHEIGHNFDRLHAPCGGPDGIDPNYPYPNANIGNYGIDVYNNELLWPDYFKDLMSYCFPQWVSDYTYIGLYNDQRAHGQPVPRMAPAQPVLLVRARFKGSQAAELLPIYSLDGFPDKLGSEGEYSIELVGNQGEVIAAYPVRRYEAADLTPPASSVYATVPLPGQAVSKIRLVHASTLLAERTMDNRPPLRVPVQATQGSGSTITLQWGGAEKPALVRYATGAGEAWITLAVDVLGGQFAFHRSQLPDEALRVEVIPADASTPIRYTLDIPAGRN